MRRSETTPINKPTQPRGSMNLFKSIFTTVFILVPSLNVVADESLCPYGGSIRNDSVCYINTLSWVEVNFQGDVLKKHKSDFEKLMRLRFRNDMSFLAHETVSPSEVYEVSYAMDKPKGLYYRQRRASASCHVWTFGNDFPIAIHIECGLQGFGPYESNDDATALRQSSLGYSSKEGAYLHVKEGIAELISRISSTFFDRRDNAIRWSNKANPK